MSARLRRLRWLSLGLLSLGLLILGLTGCATTQAGRGGAAGALVGGLPFDPMLAAFYSR